VEWYPAPGSGQLWGRHGSPRLRPPPPGLGQLQGRQVSPRLRRPPPGVGQLRDRHVSSWLQRPPLGSGRVRGWLQCPPPGAGQLRGHHMSPRLQRPPPDAGQMTKTTVSRGRSNSSKGVEDSSKGNHSAGRWSEAPGKTHRVQWAGAIRPDDHVLGCKILHRQTKRVKFHIAPVVRGKTTNREEILNHVRSKQNIVKVKGPEKNRITYGGDRKRGSIAYNDRGRIGRGRRTKSRNITN
jgi:hypothetical protein